MSKIQTLWTFGDSFTFGHGCNTECTSDIYPHYKSYKKIGDDIWPNHLGKLLKCKVKNFGKNGGSNDYILNSIVENYDYINENDYIVIGKTYPSRMDIPVNDKWEDVLSYNEIHSDLTIMPTDYVSDEIYNTVLNFQYYFSNNPLYKNRQKKWFEFMYNRLMYDKKVKECLIWNVPDIVQESFGTIRNATNGKLDDTHFSFDGHLKFSNYIHSKIIKKIL